MITVTEENIRPFVRCVGRGRGIRQTEYHRAYDHRFIGALAGGGYVEIAGTRVELTPGRAVIISPGTEYRVRSEAEGQVVVINFDWTWAHADTPETILSVLSRRFDPAGIVGQADYSLLFDGSGGFAQVECGGSSAELFESMLLTYLADDAGEMRRLRLSAQLLYLLTCAVSRPAESGRMRSAARDIYAWIVANFDKPITIADAAKEFHYWESYISKLLRRHYGTSFKQLVIDCRLTRAVWLMENTQRSREEIAAETGFYNGQHFLRTYLKKYGKNPALSK